VSNTPEGSVQHIPAATLQTVMPKSNKFGGIVCIAD
jgi:hypothetical protein